MQLLFVVAFCTIFISLTTANGYGNLDDDSDSIQVQSHSAEPQKQPSSGSGGDNYWWMKSNPFQKPANHPGVERGDQSQQAPSNAGQRPSSAFASSQPSLQQQRPSQQGQYTGTQGFTGGNNNYGFTGNSDQYNQNQFQQKPQANNRVNAEGRPSNSDCLLRNKADCHGGASGAIETQNQPWKGQQQAYPQDDIPQFNEPQSNQQSQSQQFQDPYPVRVPVPQNKPSPGGRQPPTSFNNQQGKNPQRNYPHVQPYNEYSGNTNQQARPQYNANQSPFQSQSPQYTNQQQTQSQGPPEEQVPYPGCPAAMLCVPETFCNAKGVSEGKPLQLSPAEKRYRVALMECSMEMTSEVGVCCRDPDYKDPWPNMQGGSGGKFDDGQYHPPGANHQHPVTHAQGAQSAPLASNQNFQQQPQAYKPFNTQTQQSGSSGYSSPSGLKPRPSTRNNEVYKCNYDETCIESFLCNRKSSRETGKFVKNCQPNGNELKGFVCCEKVNVNYQNFDSSNQKATTSSGGLVTGHGFPNRENEFPEPNDLLLRNPYKENEKPIYLLSESEASTDFPTNMSSTDSSIIPQTESPQSNSNEEIPYDTDLEHEREALMMELSKSESNDNIEVETTTMDSIGSQNQSTTTEDYSQYYRPNPFSLDEEFDPPEPLQVPSRFYDLPSFAFAIETTTAKPDAEASDIKQNDTEAIQSTSDIKQNDTDTEASESKIDPIGIRSGFPFKKTNFVEQCPNSMKCLRESYCQEENLNEGTLDQFDVRLLITKTRKLKCRQPNLPVNGVCCFLREDYNSPVTTKPYDIIVDYIEKERPEDSCGIRRTSSNLKEKKPNITEFGEFNWHALIMYGNVECSGVIISNKIVATTASCVNRLDKISEIRIYLGKWSLEGESEKKPIQIHRVTRVQKHPKYSVDGSYYNIALLYTSELIKFDYHISRICLPESISNFESKRCISTGWGTSRVTNGPNFLFQMDTRILSPFECANKLLRMRPNRNKLVLGSTICTMGVTGSNACNMDEGSPIVCEMEHTNGYTLAGILHRSQNGDCNDSESTDFGTNVPAVVEWIQKAILDTDETIYPQQRLRPRPT